MLTLAPLYFEGEIQFGVISQGCSSLSRSLSLSLSLSLSGSLPPSLSHTLC